MKTVFLAKDSYIFPVNWFWRFPQFQSYEFYIVRESYTCTMRNPEKIKNSQIIYKGNIKLDVVKCSSTTHVCVIVSLDRSWEWRSWVRNYDLWRPFHTTNLLYQEGVVKLYVWVWCIDLVWKCIVAHQIYCCSKFDVWLNDIQVYVYIYIYIYDAFHLLFEK